MCRISCSNLSTTFYKPEFVCVDLIRMHQYCYQLSRICMQTLTESWFVRSKGHTILFFFVCLKRTTKPDIIFVSTSCQSNAVVYWTFRLSDEQQQQQKWQHKLSRYVYLFICPVQKSQIFLNLLPYEPIFDMFVVFKLWIGQNRVSPKYKAQ